MPPIRKIQIRGNAKEKRTWTENFYIYTSTQMGGGNKQDEVL
jgi:hypothetical protein